MVNDFMPMTGELDVEHVDGITGAVSRYHFKNQVVNVGRNWTWTMATSATPPARMGWMAVGTSNTATTNGDTTLGAELARVTTTNNGTVAGNTVTFVGSYPPGTGTGVLQEAGIFNAAAAGTMLAHTVFAGSITKGALDTVTITWQITLN